MHGGAPVPPRVPAAEGRRSRSTPPASAACACGASRDAALQFADLALRAQGHGGAARDRAPARRRDGARGGTPVAPGTMPVTRNPLGKIPVLEREDGPALYDSRVICRYLDDLAGGGLYPEKPRLWETLTLEATGDGMMEAAVLMVYEERTRPEEKRSTAGSRASGPRSTAGSTRSRRGGSPISPGRSTPVRSRWAAPSAISTSASPGATGGPGGRRWRPGRDALPRVRRCRRRGRPAEG